MVPHVMKNVVLVDLFSPWFYYSPLQHYEVSLTNLNIQHMTLHPPPYVFKDDGNDTQKSIKYMNNIPLKCCGKFKMTKITVIYLESRTNGL